MPPPRQEDSTLQTVLDYLRRPGAAVAGGVGAYAAGEDIYDRVTANLTGERADDFDDVLAEQGYEDTWGRRVAGFAGDVALDPLNLLPVGAGTRLLGKGLGAAAGGAARGLRAAGLDEFVDGAGAVTNAFGRAFVPYYELRGTPAYAKMRRLFDSERRSLPARTYDDLLRRFDGVTGDERKAIGLALDAGDDGAALSTRARRALLEQRAANRAMGEEGVALDILDEDAVARRAEDYTPYVFDTPGAMGRPAKGRMINPTSPFAKERTTASLGEAVVKGAEADVAVASLVRGLDHARSAQSARLLKQVVDSGVASDAAGPGMAQLGDLVHLTAAQQAKFGQKWVPQAVAEDLKTVFTRGEETEPLMAGIERAMQMWRKGATVLRPGFHATNLLGNIYNGALGGLKNPLRYLQGIRESASPELAASLGQSAETLNDLMRKHGMTPVGQFGDTFGAGELGKIHSTGGLKEHLRKQLDTPEGRTLNPWKWYSRGMTKLGDAVEGSSKRALFYDELAKGARPEDAILGVKDKLFDYAELTDFEKKYARNAFPFYTWMRKNVPLQLKSLVDRPIVPANYAKGVNALEDLGEDRGFSTPMASRPEWYQKQGYLPLLRRRDGSQLYVNPYLPVGDFNKIPGLGRMSSIADALGDLVSGLSPAIKAPLEIATNRSFFNGRSIYDSSLGLFEDRKPAPSLFQIPGLRDALQVLPLVSSDKQGRTVLPTATNYTFEQALPFLSSVGRAGQSYLSPEEASNAAGLEKFLGVPLAERTREQQKRDRQASVRRAAALSAARRGQASLDTATLEDSRARAARLLARLSLDGLAPAEDLPY